jgi:hypothetical protein
MKTIKHIGKLKNTGSKVIVVFRTLPGESQSALVLGTHSLPDMYHDALIQLVESEQGQNSNEFGEIMFIRKFPDGRSMLSAMQQDNRLQKVPTNMVIMTPTLNSSIPLDELNLIIAQQKNIPVDELASLVSGGKPYSKSSEPAKIDNNLPTDKIKENIDNTVLTDKDLARNFRSQADALYKEAAKLRKQADELDPPQKKTSVKTKETENA